MLFGKEKSPLFLALWVYVRPTNVLKDMYSQVMTDSHDHVQEIILSQPQLPGSSQNNDLFGVFRRMESPSHGSFIVSNT